MLNIHFKDISLIIDDGKYFRLTYGRILVYRTPKVFLVKSDFTKHFWNSIN